MDYATFLRRSDKLEVLAEEVVGTTTVATTAYYGIPPSHSQTGHLDRASIESGSEDATEERS